MCSGSYSEFFTIAKPGAGAGLSRTVPAEYYELALAIHVSITTSAAVANRTPFLTLQQGDGTVIAKLSHNILIPAATTAELTWVVDTDTVSVGTAGPSACPLPHFRMPPGWKFVIGASNIDVADQFTAATILVERSPSGPESAPTGATPYHPSVEIVVAR